MMVNNIPNQFGGTLLNQRSFRGSHVLEVKINLRHQPDQIDVGEFNKMSEFGLDGIISELNFCDVEHEMEFKPEKTYTGFIFCGVYDFVADQYYPDIALPTYRSVSEPLRKGTVVLRCTQWPADFDPEHPERDNTYGDKINGRFSANRTYLQHHPSLWGEEEFTIGTETKKVREWLSEDARVQPHDKILKQFLRGPTGTKHNSWNGIQTDYRGHNLELLMVGITYQGGNWQIKSGQMNNHYYTLADDIPEYLHRSEYEDLQLIQSIYSENLHNTLPIFTGLNQGIKNKLDRHKENVNELNQIFGRRQNINLLDGRPNELTGDEVRTILGLVTQEGSVNADVFRAYYNHGARNNQNAFGSQATMSRYLNDLVYNRCPPDLFFGEYFDIFSISRGGRDLLNIEAWQKDLINKSFIQGKTNIPPSIPYFKHSQWNNYIVQKGIIYLRHPGYSISSFYKPPDNITDDHSYFIRLPSDGNIVNFNVQQLDVMFDGLSKKLNYNFDLHSRHDLNQTLPLLGAVETNAFLKDLIYPNKDIILGLINDSMDDQSKPFLVEFFTRVINEAAHDFTIYNNLNNILSFIFILIVVINNPINPINSINNNRRRILKLLISKMFSSFQSTESLYFSRHIDSIPNDYNYKFLLAQKLQINIDGERLREFGEPDTEKVDTAVNINQQDFVNYCIAVKISVTNNGREQELVCKTPIRLIPEWIRNNTADWTTKNPDGTRKVYNHNIIRRSMNPERKIRVRPITITRNIEGYNQLSSNLIDKLLDSAPVITNAIDSYSTKCIEIGCIKELLKYLQVKHRSMDMILNQKKASVIFYDNTKGIILSPKELSQHAYGILAGFITKYGSQNALVPNKYYYINTATNQLELKEVANGGRQRVPAPQFSRYPFIPQAVQQQPVPPRAPQAQANPYSNQILNEMKQGEDVRRIINRIDCESNFGFFAGRPGNKNCIRRNQTSATRGADNCERARDITGSCPTGPDNDCYIHKFGNNPTTDCIPKWSYKNGVGTVLWRQPNSFNGNQSKNQYGDTEDTLIPATQRTQQKYLKYKLKYLRLKEIARKHNIKID